MTCSCVCGGNRALEKLSGWEGSGKGGETLREKGYFSSWERINIQASVING